MTLFSRYEFTSSKEFLYGWNLWVPNMDDFLSMSYRWIFSVAFLRLGRLHSGNFTVGDGEKLSRRWFPSLFIHFNSPAEMEYGAPKWALYAGRRKICGD